MMIHMVFQEIRMFKRMWLALLLSVSGLAYAQPSIEAVTGSLQGGGEVVKIDLSQALDALPTGFAIQSPARIALDFPGVANSMRRSTV
jgi:type IV pilus assembly protein PilQ